MQFVPRADGVVVRVYEGAYKTTAGGLLYIPDSVEEAKVET
jgi:co-chaperonin GroES (HSP10)